MNISIFGLGYVGAVTAGCLARQGHQIMGVDVQAQKVELFNQGVPPIIEPGLGELLKAAKAAGRLGATTSCEEAIAATEVSIVCVGTPSTVSGALDLGFVRQVLREISEAIRKKSARHRLILRSTMLPGSTQGLVDETLAEWVADGLVEVFYFPEFLREGTAVKDFEQPALSVVGTRDGQPVKDAPLGGLFGDEVVTVDWATAELVKYACNSFHAAKITFANEIGRVGKSLGVDTRRVMELLCRDTRLNISSYYLRPGNPFGGSCLPKDVRALTQHARASGLSVPLLENLLPSNQRHLEQLLAAITATGQREIVILGLAFKSNTDDLRESAMVEVAQALMGRGHTLRIFDPALNLAALIGSNKRLIDVRMPHLASLLKTDLGEALGERGLIVAALPVAAIDELQARVRPGHEVLDVNGWPELEQLPVRYHGFCW
jgi:GDP-mannose 6-dehydrogenase